MIWHIVRLDFAGVDDNVRGDLERRLAELARIDAVAFLRVERDIGQPTVTGLITGFASVRELESYRVDPEHVPVVEALRAAGVGTVRLDIATADVVADLPA